jgi:hypothetical protein
MPCVSMHGIWARQASTMACIAAGEGEEPSPLGVGMGPLPKDTGVMGNPRLISATISGRRLEHAWRRIQLPGGKQNDRWFCDWSSPNGMFPV